MFALIKHPLSFLSCLLFFQLFSSPIEGNQSFDCNLLTDSKQEINITLPDNINSTSFNFVGIKDNSDGVCKWILNTLVESSLKLEVLTLDSNDKLTVKGLKVENNTTLESLLFVGNDLPNPGFVDTKIFNRVVIELNLSKDKPKVKRSFSAQFNLHESIVLDEPEGLLTVQLNQRNTSSNAKLVFTSPYSKIDQYAFILDFINLPDKYNIQINDVVYMNPNNPIPQYLLLDKSMFTLNVNDFIPSNNPIAFRYWSVTKACSGNVNLLKDYKDKDFVIPTISDEVRRSMKLTMARCVQVVTGDVKQQIMVNIPDNLSALLHPQDSLTFYDANKSIELSLNGMALMYFRNVDTFLEKDKYLVIYKIPFFSEKFNDKFVAPSLRLVRDSGCWMIDNDKMINKTIGDGKAKHNDTHLLYSSMFTQPGNEDAQEVQLHFVTRQVSPGDWSISIYTNEYKNSKPIIVLGKYDLLPKVISSPNGVMRVEFKGILPKIDFIYKTVNKKKSCSFVGGNSPFSQKAFNIKGGQSDDVCSWVIPDEQSFQQNDNSTHFTILSPVYVKIPENATLDFTQFLPKGSTVQHFKGPIEKNFMPDLFLSSSYSYELSIMPHDFEQNKLHLMVEQRVDYSNSPIVIDEFSSRIRSINYPGSYPIGYDQLYYASGQGQVLMTVEDISILKNHSVTYLAHGEMKEISISNDIEQVYDEILSLPILFYLNTSVYNVEQLIKENIEHVRGFDIQTLHVGNSSNIQVQNSTMFSFSAGNTSFTYPIVIWSLKHDDKSSNISDHIFKINVTYNHDPKDSKSQIMIYDSKSIRTKSKHEALLNVNSSSTLEKQYMTSTKVAYIIYNYTDSIQSKLDYGVKFEVIVEKCHNSRNYSLTKCEKFDRCITDLMICNGHDDCGDWSDERFCNGSVTPNPPVPQASGGGVSILVVIFLLMPISAILGIFGYVYLPNLLMRLRHGRYSEFRDLSSVS